MRIAMIQDEWWPFVGGGAIHVRDLSIALARNHDHTIDIYTRSLKDKNGEIFNENETFVSGDVRVYRCRPTTRYYHPIGRFGSLVSSLPALWKNDYELIHGHTYLPAVPTKVARATTGAPTVFTIHGTALTSGVGRTRSSIVNRIKRRLEELFVLGFDYDRVISVNQEYMDLFGEHHDNIVYIPNGVDVDRFDVSTVSDKQTILFVGRLVQVKRVRDLMDAYAKLADQFPDTELLIVGEGPDRESLENRAQQHGIAEKVTFVGHVPYDRISSYYTAADLFVLPSVREGHPMTLLEAWAAKIPVITTTGEGIAEFVSHMKNGYLVPPRSSHQLAQALEFALENPDIARRWAEAGYKTAQSNYSWEQIAQQTHELYTSVVAESHD